MRILVTGGTGYVGAVATAAMVDAGHEVKLLVRSPERVGPALEPLGVSDVPFAVGDVTDRASVAEAMEGCEAVVHAASVYSLDARAAEEMERINVPGTVNVLEEAASREIDPIVYVSSTVSFLPGRGSPVGPDSPVGDPAVTYARTKAAAEREARRLQEAGAPIGIVYPGLVLGPGDPYLSEGHLLIRELLKRRLPVIPRGGFQAVDSRDTARTVLAVLEPGRGPGRYMVPGEHLTLPELARRLSRLTGRRLPTLTVPAGAMMPAVRAADLAQRWVPFRIPASAEAIYTTRCDMRVDDSRTRRELGVEPRPLADSLADSVRWMLRRGQIGPRQAGTLAAEPRTGEPAKA